MIFYLALLQSNLVDEAKTLLQQLQNLSNPIYYSIFIAIVVVFLTIIFFKYIYIPVQEKHELEKGNLELKNSRIMALFAELDPDPVIRVDLNGIIIKTNDAALKIDESKDIIGLKINSLLPFLDIDIGESIKSSKSSVYTWKINNKFYSILFRGNSYLEIGQIYFRDITEQKRAQEELIASQKQLKNLSNHLQNILEEERYRIARELHDGLGQNLSLTRLEINNLISENHLNKTAAELKKIVLSIDSTITELKGISHRLKPKVLEEMGLEPSLNSLVAEVSDKMDINGAINFVDFEIRLEPKLELCIYRIVQETLTNIIKHSNATSFSVQLINSKKMIRIIVSDNGVGFDPSKVQKKENESGGMGIINIQERIINYDGTLQIDSTPGNGTIIIVEIPNNRV